MNSNHVPFSMLKENPDDEPKAKEFVSSDDALPSGTPDSKPMHESTSPDLGAPSKPERQPDEPRVPAEPATPEQPGTPSIPGPEISPPERGPEVPIKPAVPEIPQTPEGPRIEPAAPEIPYAPDGPVAPPSPQTPEVALPPSTTPPRIVG